MAGRTVIDFTNVKEPPKFRSGKEKSMTKKQIRARARRRGKISQAELNTLYKPVSDWDEEELARGRPRAKDGTFRGPAPGWVSRAIHEEAIARFRGVVESEMRQEVLVALKTVHTILKNEDIDEKGRPVISPSTKLEAAKFLLEHTVGKPTQRVETDISVRLQGLLAVATAGPINGAVDSLALPPGVDYEAAFGHDDEIVDAELT